MKIIHRKDDTPAEQWRDWHIRTVGEAGFSMLDIYGRSLHGLEIDQIQNFADQINQSDESGTLYPRAPITAVPRRFFRDLDHSSDPAVLKEFSRHISEFIQANRQHIRSSKILVDFHVSSSPVPSQYVEATEEIFRLCGQDDLIEEVVILI